jgi:hypothetical protein
MTRARLAAVFVTTLAALAQGYEPAQDLSRQLLAEDEALLADALREVEGTPAFASTFDGASRRQRAMVVRGAINFFRPFPGGNGRACATCHDPRDGFSLSPARV